jgi:hypothetical protein
MKRLSLVAFATALVTAVSAAPDPASEKFWPQWHGPYATGVSKTADPPVEWSETKNLRWKVEIPGRGSGTPVIWGDKVFVQGRVYVAGQDGTTIVIKQGPVFGVLAKNALDDGFDASPALVDSELYLRGFKYLYSIGSR